MKYLTVDSIRRMLAEIQYGIFLLSIQYLNRKYEVYRIKILSDMFFGECNAYIYTRWFKYDRDNL
jgi:hypothetical protein